MLLVTDLSNTTQPEMRGNTHRRGRYIALISENALSLINWHYLRLIYGLAVWHDLTRCYRFLCAAVSMTERRYIIP